MLQSLRLERTGGIFAAANLDEGLDVVDFARHRGRLLVVVLELLGSLFCRFFV